MRYLAILVAAFALAGCSRAPVKQSETQPVSPSPEAAPASRTTSIDPSVVEFLLTSAATDFHAHLAPGPIRVRDVRIGKFKSSDGEEQYRLCGQFLPAPKADKAEWTAFVTIKTSGYEQYVGARAAGYSQDPSVVWDKAGDFSSSLQSRLDSLRKKEKGGQGDLVK